jgi:hypothetical protein
MWECPPRTFERQSGKRVGKLSRIYGWKDRILRYWNDKLFKFLDNARRQEYKKNFEQGVTRAAITTIKKDTLYLL